MPVIPEGVGRGAHYGTVGEPCFGTNGPARPELYHGLTENRRETTIALCEWGYQRPNYPNPRFSNNP
uniref:SFRICE_022611 n=1 Tax=Spodoptera frugiperda TaxID=7108 RepID=A0A2H1WKJ8_SPOFR